MIPTSRWPSSRTRGARRWVIVILLLMVAASLFRLFLMEQGIEATSPGDKELLDVREGVVEAVTNSAPTRVLPPPPEAVSSHEATDPAEVMPPFAPPNKSVPEPNEVHEPAIPSVPDPKEIDRTVDPQQ